MIRELHDERREKELSHAGRKEGVGEMVQMMGRMTTMGWCQGPRMIVPLLLVLLLVWRMMMVVTMFARSVVTP